MSTPTDNSQLRVGLVAINRLTITFLVDNSIEWFAKLPPGFKLELPQHLSDPRTVKDPLTGVPIINLEDFCCGAHGFSALIETQRGDDEERHLTLFDTGPDSKSIVRNVMAMQVPVDQIERVVLSHWHSDHSGGMLSFLQMRSPGAPKCVVDLHPDRPTARGIAIPPTYETIIGRLPADPTFELITSAGGVVEKHAEGHTVAGATIYVSGEIPRVTTFEQGLLGAVRFVEEDSKPGRWTSEPHIMDERYVAVDVIGKGVIIFSACSHAGIVNVVKDTVQRFSRPIYMIIGGLHLGSADLASRIAPTVDFLANQLRPSPTYVLPMHCSGFQCKVALDSALGEGCVPAGVGVKVEVHGDRGQEDRLSCPTFT
ncbi:metallo-beta-lactamase protein [Pisolithus orientalis]|uniref:metallo-beta-lactamase protein n=1 Tax=Pisolithus orientalis TaxID=936130 RepID=UPI002224C900|nr:metallo-beta-lactamase protein [Pisolithus orientalis]KAI6032946.1 metallo-beta-lactamase protein [Pisolithus orientalis]